MTIRVRLPGIDDLMRRCRWDGTRSRPATPATPDAPECIYYRRRATPDLTIGPAEADQAGARPISANLSKASAGRMYFVPEGQHDSSQARSASGVWTFREGKTPRRALGAA